MVEKNHLLKISPKSLRDYFLQVSLIILSLFIATRVDRCNLANKNEEKLQAYLTAIELDLQDELELNENNLFDCEQDIKGLEHGIKLLRHNQDDSIRLAIQEIFTVFTRGVFRSFSPTTYEIMSNSGDILLIKDLELRGNLAAVFAFRTDYLKTDLLAYDKLAKKTAEKLGHFLDLACLAGQQADPIACVTKREQLIKDPHNELTLLVREAELRAFHLEKAIMHLKRTLLELQEKQKG